MTTWSPQRGGRRKGLAPTRAAVGGRESVRRCRGRCWSQRPSRASSPNEHPHLPRRGHSVRILTAQGWWVGIGRMETIGLASAVSGEIVVSSAERLRYAAGAYLARFKGQSRVHTESDLRGYLMWCRSRGLDPLAASRVHIELFLRWMQELRGYQPSTVSRRLSVISGSTGPWSTHPPSTCAGLRCPRSRPHSG